MLLYSMHGTLQVSKRAAGTHVTNTMQSVLYSHPKWALVAMAECLELQISASPA
jgi:hypothetical protein